MYLAISDLRHILCKDSRKFKNCALMKLNYLIRDPTDDFIVYLVEENTAKKGHIDNEK